MQDIVIAALRDGSALLVMKFFQLLPQVTYCLLAQSATLHNVCALVAPITPQPQLGALLRGIQLLPDIAASVRLRGDVTITRVAHNVLSMS